MKAKVAAKMAQLMAAIWHQRKASSFNGESASGENGENNGAARRTSAAGGESVAVSRSWQRIVSMAAAKAAMAAVAVSAAVMAQSKRQRKKMA
jgi:hypothetical protein